MEFREYATHETNAVVARLMASQADAQVRLAREAIEAAARALDGKAAPVAAADDVRDLVQRLEAAAGIAVQRVQQEAETAVAAAREELAGARREAAEAEGRVAALSSEVAALADRATTAEGDLDATIEAHRQIEIELGGLRRELEGARATIARLESGLEAGAAQRATLADDLAAVRASAASVEAGLAAAEAATAEEADARATLQGELDAARSRLATLEESRATLRAELESVQSVWKAAEAELESTRAALSAMEAEFAGARTILDSREIELDAARTTLGAVEGDLDAARASASAAMAELDATQAAASAMRAELETTRHALAAAEGELAAARRGLDDAQRRTPLIEAAAVACGSLSSARTISELFGALVGEMSSEFTRVAIFRAKAHHLEGEYGHGFDVPTDVSKLVIPLALDSIITRAHASGLMSRLEPGQAGGSTPLGGSPSLALALPIMHQGETVAVLYADAEDPATGAGDERPAFAQLLATHAALVLARMSQEMKTLHELRDYAAMLLQEAQEMYAADGEAGRSDADRRRRLQDTVECARQLYAQRAALEGAAAAGLLDEQIAEATGEAPSTPFARDLALCDPARQNARRTAS